MSLDLPASKRATDDEVLRRWAEAGLYRWSPDLRGDTFSSVIPAPNPTGELHLGHALNLSIQDLLCRAHRLQGRSILWAGALDHGSFPTQVVVERQLRAAGAEDTLADPRAVERAIRNWIAKISPRIFQQIRQFGVVMDMDPPASMWDPVNEQLTVDLFLELHAKGLTYEAEMVTDWCARCRTALEKVEMVPAEFEDEVLMVRYRAVDDDAVVVDVPTSTPEILPAVVALMVPEEDARFVQHRGRWFRSAIGNPVPLLEAERTDTKPGPHLVVPGHCAWSGRLARRSGLEGRVAFDQHGVMREGPFTGRSREEARALATTLLRERGALVGEQRSTVPGATCKKCGDRAEAFATRQWFVRVAPLIEPALEALKKGEVRIHPKRYDWMCRAWLAFQLDARRQQSCEDMVDDWCVSRRIQCGTRIPMSHCACGAVAVGREPRPCEACGATTQPVEEVIDLKLADVLWAFFLNRRYTQDRAVLAKIGRHAVCVTGLDLLFYWILPIVMVGQKLEDPLPFRDVVIHPLITDANGNKMGKSVGNVVVPSEVIDRYGADCLRLTLLDGLDLASEKLFFLDEKLVSNRRWLDRLIAAADLVCTRAPSGPRGSTTGRLADLEAAFRSAIESYRLGELHSIACAAIERLERALMQGESAGTEVLGDVLELLHPLAPLTTESLWMRAFPVEGFLSAHVSAPGQAPATAVA